MDLCYCAPGLLTAPGEVYFIKLAGQKYCSKYLMLWHVAMAAKVPMSEVLSTGKAL